MNNRYFVEKEEIIKAFIKDSKQILKDNLVSGYLFGSYTRSEQTSESDIDILFIVRKFNSKIRNEMSSLSADYSIEQDVIISPIIKDIHVWKRNQKHNTFFYTEIIKDGIKLC
jgi:predicted nucleotidyltransferase